MTSARGALRRHGTGTQFANDFFPSLGACWNIFEVRRLQGKSAGASFVAMAGGAVASHNFGLLCMQWTDYGKCAKPRH